MLIYSRVRTRIYRTVYGTNTRARARYAQVNKSLFDSRTLAHILRVACALHVNCSGGSATLTESE